MKKLTIFTAPKPFTDTHIATIQRNAILSWLEMGDKVEILLMGEELGIAETAKELNVIHVPEVKKNTHGTPLVSSIFQLARNEGKADLFLFTNTDILFFPETLELALQMKQQTAEFVLLGRRYDLDVGKPIEFSPGWAEQLKEDISSCGHLHPLGGSDYFIFPSPLYAHIPDFAIGRAGWDNWMIYHAMQQGWLVVDATPNILAVHQIHDYGHLENEHGHQRHPETQENLKLAGGMRKMFSLLDVKFRLVEGKVQRIPWSLTRLLHLLEHRLQPDELVGRGLRWWLLRGVRKLRRALQRTEVS